MTTTCDHKDKTHETTNGLVCCHCYEEWVRGHFQIPQPTLDGIQRWIEHAILPGGFLASVMRNDPMSVVVGAADLHNGAVLKKIYHHLINRVPHACWGSADKMQAWAKTGGTKGGGK